MSLEEPKVILPSGSVDERSVEFVLRHSETISLPSVKELLTSTKLVHPFCWKSEMTFTRKCHWRDAYDAFQQELREELWQQKSLLEEVDDNVLYRRVRDKLFPLSVSGKQSCFFSNRAGHKLLETMEATGVWDKLSQHSVTRKAGTLDEKTWSGNKVEFTSNLKLQGNNTVTADINVNINYIDNNCDRKKTSKCAVMAKQKNRKSSLRKRQWARCKRIIVKNRLTFADICGGPGSFAEALLSMGKRYHLHWTGFGMTLANVEGLDWYSSLRRKRFVTTYGVDSTGDIFSLANVEALQSMLHGYNVQLVVADGGFHVEPSLANFQETISSRILYAQWFVALRLLCDGGCFILKLFDTFAPLTRVILYLSTFLFRSVHIVKPKHSRVVNSERYLVCMDWQAENNKVYFAHNAARKECNKNDLQEEWEESQQKEIKQEEEEISWMSYLEHVYEYGFTDNDYVPDVIPSEWMARDQTFMDDLAQMNSVIANNQITALKMVMKELQEEVQSAKESNNESVCISTNKYDRNVDKSNDNHDDNYDDDDCVDDNDCD